MARTQFDTLTQPMFYILLALEQERSGVEICNYVKQLTHQRVILPPGTLYALLATFLELDMIKEVGNKTYIITYKGGQLIHEERKRLEMLIEDYDKVINKSIK